ncbi:MAG TPA: hypothetical protein VMK05_06970 [Burkholderiales bacterium]|nr:hypothetical protein [Burkholderiales bacterium]
MRPRSAHAARFTAPLLLALAFDVSAILPEEIQVYDDDVNAPRELSLELHANYAVQGLKTPAFPGQLPSHHVLQMTPEFSLGLAPNWDAGLYLLSTLAPGGSFDVNGAKLRVKYIAPHAEAQALFWGINGEIGNTSRRVNETNWNYELRPIVGWRGDKWLVAFNPVLGGALSDKVSREPALLPMFKVAREVAQGYSVGFEHYADVGPIHHRDPLSEQSHLLYGVVDVARGALDLNLGIGRGLNDSSERWVIKAIIGFPLK